MNESAWQFSIRQLLVLTAITATVLTAVVWFPHTGVVVLCVLPVALSIVWLRLFHSLPSIIRRRLGITVLLTYGSLGFLAAATSAWQLARANVESTAFLWFLVAAYGLVAVLCYHFAAKILREADEKMRADNAAENV